jgi:DNA-binding XRE family transcriptional regulator
MSSNTFVLVENASRFVTKARLVGEALQVHFADGARGTLPPEVVKGKHRVPPTAVAIPTPYKVVLHFGRSSSESFPWDYLRGFCDMNYRARAAAQADVGRRKLGQRIRTLRGALGLSQTGLAAAAKIGRVTLARVELGLQSPNVATLEALARALGVEFPDLLSGN